MVKFRTVAKEHTHWKLGTSECDFWMDSWLDIGSLGIMEAYYNSLAPSSQDNGTHKASHAGGYHLGIMRGA
ncbi:hypothetical protein Leryth_021636 [Lithospermum erythrorhizon]|nr:hypothetical protein Leryth_021636 [Lithospermum erythrorhizon]